MKRFKADECGSCARFGIRAGKWLFVPPSADAAFTKCMKSPLPLGDYVEAVTKATGIKWAVDKIMRGVCGCGKRKRALNELGARVVGKIGLQT